MYIYLVCPLVAFAIAQGIKIMLRASHKKVSWKDAFSYSDMPSGHTAIVASLVAIIGLKLGVDSYAFAISFVFAAIVVTDAVGIRNYLGQHGKTLNILVKDLGEDEFLDRSYPIQLEKIGHTPLQVIIGGLIGVAISVIGYLLF